MELTHVAARYAMHDTIYLGYRVCPCLTVALKPPSAYAVLFLPTQALPTGGTTPTTSGTGPLGHGAMQTSWGIMQQVPQVNAMINASTCMPSETSSLLIKHSSYRSPTGLRFAQSEPTVCEASKAESDGLIGRQPTCHIQATSQRLRTCVEVCV